MMQDLGVGIGSGPFGCHAKADAWVCGSTACDATPPVSGLRLVAESARQCALVRAWPGRPASVGRSGRHAEFVVGDRC
jgi:hypothetical protein